MAHNNAVVVLYEQMPLDLALKKLKDQLLKVGAFKEMKKRAYYEKPSLRKRRKQAEASKRQRKREQQVAVALSA